MVMADGDQGEQRDIFPLGNHLMLTHATIQKTNAVQSPFSKEY